MPTLLALPRETAPDVDDDLTRRRLLAGAGGLALTPWLASCADDPGTTQASGSASTPDSTPTATTAFPVTLSHKFGETEIRAEPRRIVTVGRIEQDALLALGVVPVGTTNWVGEHEGAIYPWAKEALGDAEVPTSMDNIDGPKFEQIAALDPDLILAIYSDLPEGDYDKLAQIAPTVAPPKEYVDLGVPWQDLTRTIGRAVGRADRADEIVAAVEDRFAQARAENPEFDGAVAMNVYFPGSGTYQVYPPPDLGGRLMADLGFEVPQEILDLADGAGYVDLSTEQAELLDVDALLWLVDDLDKQDELLEDPVYSRLDVSTEGREVFFSYADDSLSEATSVQTVLSLPFLLDRLVPMLAAALDGDAETSAEPTGSATGTPATPS